MKKTFALVPFFILAVCSCNERATNSTRDSNEIVAEVRTALHDYYDDIGKNGLTAEFKYLDKSDSFYWVPPGYSSALSYDTVAAIIRRTAPLFRSVHTSFDTLRIQLLGDGTATYTARLSSTMTDTSGKTGVYHLVESGVVIKRASGWKLLCGQTALLNEL